MATADERLSTRRIGARLAPARYETARRAAVPLPPRWSIALARAPAGRRYGCVLSGDGPGVEE
jgi:hypothetical protein